jgi:hypothetical protein
VNTQISSHGVDGEEVHFVMPSELELSTLVATSEIDLEKHLGILPLIYGSNILDLEVFTITAVLIG